MYGEVSVEMLSESESPEWTVRKFRLGYVSGDRLWGQAAPPPSSSRGPQHLFSVSLQADESRDVLHLNYTSWPDHGVPTVNAIESILQFVHIVRQQANRTKDPIVVHCRSFISPGSHVSAALALALAIVSRVWPQSECVPKAMLALQLVSSVTSVTSNQCHQCSQ